MALQNSQRRYAGGAYSEDRRVEIDEFQEWAGFRQCVEIPVIEAAAADTFEAVPFVRNSDEQMPVGFHERPDLLQNC